MNYYEKDFHGCTRKEPCKDKSECGKWAILAFEGSQSHAMTKHKTLEQLQYKLGYVKGAIVFHQKTQSPCQVKFFQDMYNFMVGRISRLKKEQENDLQR